VFHDNDYDNDGGGGGDDGDDDDDNLAIAPLHSNVL